MTPPVAASELQALRDYRGEISRSGFRFVRHEESTAMVDYASPEDIRASARRVRSRAESMAFVAQRLQREAAAMTFTGPAATGLKLRVSDRRRDVLRLAGELQDLSNVLFRVASTIEQRLLST